MYGFERRKKCLIMVVYRQSHHPGTFNSTVVATTGKYDDHFSSGEDPDKFSWP
jgi:hypothetical protein